MLWRISVWKSSTSLSRIEAPSVRPAYANFRLADGEHVSYLGTLLLKYREDELFRRLAIGSPTWAEMIAEAVMRDTTGVAYRLAGHNAPSVDLVSDDGQHVQVKTIGTRGSFAGIRRGHDSARHVFVITTFEATPRFFLVPMSRFKEIARTYDYPEKNLFTWEISGARIAKGTLDEFEIQVDDAALRVARASFAETVCE